MRVNNIPKSVILPIPFKSHIPRESQHQHFIEHQSISRNFKQSNLHQQIYSFQKCKQMFHTVKERNVTLARVPTCPLSS